MRTFPTGNTYIGQSVNCVADDRSGSDQATSLHITAPTQARHDAGLPYSRAVPGRQPLTAKRPGAGLAGRRPRSGQEPDASDSRRLLGLCIEWRHDLIRARYEELPVRDHWITSSARSNTDCGIVMPMAFAILRLMTN